MLFTLWGMVDNAVDDTEHHDRKANSCGDAKGKFGGFKTKAFSRRPILTDNAAHGVKQR